MLKRFLVFGALDAYYAAGGMADFLGDFDSLEAARAHAETPVQLDRCEWDTDESYRKVQLQDLEWWHIFDSESRKVVLQSGTAYGQGLICDKASFLGSWDPGEQWVPRGLR